MIKIYEKLEQSKLDSLFSYGNFGSFVGYMDDES